MLVGCSRTVTGGYTDSDDGSLRIFGRVLGAYGKAFSDRTTKTVCITIVERRSHRNIFSSSYKMMGGEVEWHATWDGNTIVRIDMTEVIGTSTLAKTNHLRTIILEEMPSGDTFWVTKDRMDQAK